MDHNNDNAVFWDDKGFYTVRWEETGNNDIPHKKYIYEAHNEPKYDFDEENKRAEPLIKIQKLKDWLEENIKNKQDNVSKEFTSTGWDAARLQLEAYNNMERKIRSLDL